MGPGSSVRKKEQGIVQLKLQWAAALQCSYKAKGEVNKGDKVTCRNKSWPTINKGLRDKESAASMA